LSTAPRIAGDRPVPHIITELPGPKARAHVDFDHTWTSPSLPRAYPLVPVRGEGSTIEDIDGNLFLDFAAGIAVNSTGHAHPPGRGRDQGAGRGAAPFLCVRLLPADLR
jgi:4-aminobutyrate aminotransferase and related aminotransferases